MTNTLRLAGVPREVLDLIPPITDTCGACRTWQTPRPDSVPSAIVPEHFNDDVEVDLLFIGKYSIFHMICRAIRWHAAMLIPNKETETFIDALNDLWVRHHGPMRRLHVDGECAIASIEGHTYLTSRGIDYKPRAPGQHARFIERRGALLRDSIHKIQTQMNMEV